MELIDLPFHGSATTMHSPSSGFIKYQSSFNTNFIRERTIGRSRCRLERIVKRGKTDYSPFYHSGSTGGITEYNLLLFSRENFAVHFRMDYSNIRTGHFGLSYVGHVKFFPVESESKFKNSYCFT